MPQPIEKELCEIEAVLYNIEREYPQIARTAAEARFAYEIAKAEAIDEIEHMTLAEGQKKPTVAAMEAAADLKIREQMEATRKATAELDIAKITLDSVQSRLSSIQTRAKMMSMEMALAR